MIKTLKISPDVSKAIKSKVKTSTWRLSDDNILEKNDIVRLLNSQTNQLIAVVKITKVSEIRLELLADKDKIGDGNFHTTEQVYTTYSHFYNRVITPDTLIEVIEFEVIENN